jgi:hypothetical protein
VAVAIIALAGCTLAGKPNGIVTQHVSDFRPSLQELYQGSLPQGAESLTEGPYKHDEWALCREFPSCGSVARTRKDAGSGGKLCFSRRIAESCLALPAARLSVDFKPLRPIVRGSWPMNQSAAKSVVLLRRLLI